MALRNTVWVVEKFLSQCHQFELDRTPYEVVYQLPELEIIRMVLSKPVLVRLVEELAQSLKTEIAETGRTRIYVKDPTFY